MRIILRLLFICALLPFFGLAQKPEIVIPSDTSLVNFRQMASVMTKGENSTTGKVRAIITWVNANLEWTATDYVNRSAKEILCKRGGNCNEEKKVAVALLNEAGIKTRMIRELNIQPENERRERSSDDLIKTRGINYSVFGLRHNDHVWTEFYDEELGKWEPADPTTGLVGITDWLKSRVGFDERPVNKILPTRDMLVPFYIGVLGDKGKIIENRSEYYLVEAFNKVYNGRLSTLPEWATWQRLINDISPEAEGAFNGSVNLHEYTGKIKEIKESYERLKAEYAQ